MNYRLNQKVLESDIDDVLHLDPAHEECNLDDTQNDEAIDAATARALAEKGHVRLCGHCFKDGVFF